MIATDVMNFMWALLICAIVLGIIVIIYAAVTQNSARICMICHQNKEAGEYEPKTSQICNDCQTRICEKERLAKKSSNPSQS